MYSNPYPELKRMEIYTYPPLKADPNTTIATLKIILLVANIILAMYETFLMMGNAETLFFILKPPTTMGDVLFFIFIALFLIFKLYAMVIGWMAYVIASKQERSSDELETLKMTTIVDLVAAGISLVGVVVLLIFTWTSLPTGTNAAIIVDFVLFAVIVAMSFTLYILLNQLVNMGDQVYTYPYSTPAPLPLHDVIPQVTPQVDTTSLPTSQLRQPVVYAPIPSFKSPPTQQEGIAQWVR